MEKLNAVIAARDNAAMVGQFIAQTNFRVKEKSHTAPAVNQGFHTEKILAGRTLAQKKDRTRLGPFYLPLRGL
jgi:hypothetical protein